MINNTILNIVHNFKIYLLVSVCFMFVYLNGSSFYVYAEKAFSNNNYYINIFNNIFLKENIISDIVAQEIVQKPSRINVTDLNRSEEMVFNPFNNQSQENGSKFIIKDNVTLIQQGTKFGFDKDKILEEKQTKNDTAH